MMILNWDEFVVVGLFALSVLGPLCVVLLAESVLDSAADRPFEIFDFDSNSGDFPDGQHSSRAATGSGFEKTLFGRRRC